MWKSVVCVTGECGACGKYVNFGFRFAILAVLTAGLPRDAWSQLKMQLLRCCLNQSYSQKVPLKKTCLFTTSPVNTLKNVQQGQWNCWPSPFPLHFCGLVHLLYLFLAEVGACPEDLPILRGTLGQAAVALTCLLLGCVGRTWEILNETGLFFLVGEGNPLPIDYNILLFYIWYICFFKGSCQCL